MPTAFVNPGVAREEVLAAVRAYVPTAGPWEQVGGYLDRSVVLRSGDMVVKCFVHAAESKWQREKRAYTFLADVNLPVPRMIASGRAREVPWLLMTALPGRIASEVLDRATAAERRVVFAAAGKLLAQLHALPADDRLTEQPLATARDTWLARLTHRLEEYSARTAKRPGVRDTSLAVAREWAVDLLPHAPHDLVCTHGDFSMRNLLVDPQHDWAIVGLIDFERCEYGDAAIDLVRMLVACPDWSDPALRAFLDAYAGELALPSRDRIALQLSAIALDAALWAEEKDPAYYHALLDLVDRVAASPESLPAVFPRG